MKLLPSAPFAALVASLSLLISSASGEKVFGLGPPRTGTDSLREALTHLGVGPTYHMGELLFEGADIPTGDDMEKWRQAGLGNDVHKNLAEILEPWGSGCDLPLMAFPDELLELYPDAKFILTVRPAEEWLASLSQTVCHATGGLGWYMPITRQIPFHPFNRFKSQFYMTVATTSYMYSGNDFMHMCDPANRDATLKWYNDWNARIRKTIPKKQLLVFRIGEHGYKELAKFLKVPLPEEPYPSTNSTAEFMKILDVLRKAAIFVIIVSILSLVLLAFLVTRLLRKIADSKAGNKMKSV